MQTQKATESHSCGDSLLKCVDCNAQVCPQCFVACPVGNRCSSCAGGAIPTNERLKKHKQSIDKLNLKITLGAIFIGVMYGWMRNHVDFSYFMFLFYIVFWAAGRESGQRIRRSNSDNGALKACVLFLAGDAAAYGALCLLMGLPLADCASVFIPYLFDVGAFIFGFSLGRCGFG